MGYILVLLSFLAFVVTIFLLIDEQWSFILTLTFGILLCNTSNRFSVQHSVHDLRPNEYVVMSNVDGSGFVIQYKGEFHGITDYFSVKKLKGKKCFVKVKVYKSFFGVVTKREIIIK